MMQAAQIRVPSLVRIKRGALDRLGVYLRRGKHRQVLVLCSPLPQGIGEAARRSVAAQEVEMTGWREVDGNEFENAVRIFASLPKKVDAVVGIGGGKALDAAKYVAFLSRLPYYAVPTSLSNDGFCSPQSSLTLEGKRKSLPSALPHGVIIDVDVCLSAPLALWFSGIGDLVSKLTAVADWKLAFHNRGEPVNDLAALLSDSTVLQFLSGPTHDASGITLLGTALMLNGIAMEITGSSRPASGSEHLVSHALDAISARPRLHGLQVGMASYIVGRLQGGNSASVIDRLFRETGFWDTVRSDPFSTAEWLEAVRIAPQMKEEYFTVLSLRDCLPEVRSMLHDDPALQGCFV